tara:strand:- start:301 stop:489 length:189 start_codon:yes stop_codon:yes gene_type:complete
MKELGSWFIVLGLIIAPYLTHLIWSIKGLFTGSFTETSQYVVSVIGIFMPPFGWLHGLYLWF